MNQMPFDTDIENPWKKRDEIPYPKTVALIPIVLIYILAALSPIFIGAEQLSLIAYIGLCAGIVYALRMPRIVISVILASFIPVALLGSFSAGVTVLGIVAGTGCGAVLLTAMPSPWRTVILPIAAWGIAFAITGDPALSCLTLITLPASLLLALATVTGQRRTTAVCYTIGGLLVTVLALLVIYFVVTYGSVSRDTIVSHFDTQREWVVGILVRYKDEMLKLLTEQGMQGSASYTALETLMSRENLVTLVAMIYNILPALVIVLCSILAYESQSLVCGTYCTLGMKKMLTPASVAFTMSTASAIIYLVTFFLTAVLPANGMASAVAQNFYLILTPGLILIGFGATVFRFRTTKGGPKIILSILLIFILITDVTALFSLLAFFGALTVIISAIGARMIGKMKEQMPPNGTNFGERMPHEESKNDSKEPSEEKDKKDSEDDTQE
ncbi:MAG: hypothetical protein IJW16_00210 [Clostridia bacterium]|nr:hypothetical protein [Clostridia bacterium]